MHSCFAAGMDCNAIATTLYTRAMLDVRDLTMTPVTCPGVSGASLLPWRTILAETVQTKI